MPDHEAIIPTAGGVPPMCSCGFIGGPPGRTMKEHLQDVAERSEHSIATETCQQRGCSEPAVATVRIDLGPGDARTAYAVSERVQLIRVCQRHFDLVAGHEPPGSVPSLARERSQRRGGVRTLALPLRDRAGAETLTLVGPDESGLYALQVTGTPTGRARGLDRDHLANQLAHLLIRLEADGVAR